MELENLLEVISFKNPHNRIAKETIEKKLAGTKENSNIEVNAPDKTVFDYNKKTTRGRGAGTIKPGEGEVPLKCKKGDDHLLDKKDGKYTFKALENKLNAEKEKPICKTCADKEGKATTGTSQSELDFKNALVDFITKELGCNVTVHFGSNKAKTEYLSKSGKSKLDYDIKIDDNNDGTKAFAISIQGAPHTPYNQSANDNDSIRAAEEAKRGRPYIITPAYLKDEKLFNNKLNDMKVFIRNLYGKITPPIQSRKARGLIRRFGPNSPQVNYRVNERNKALNDRIEFIKNSPIQKQLNQIINALQDNIGYNRTKYNGKYDNIIDYMQKDEKRFGSFENHKDEWNELINVGTKQEFDNWVNKYQAVSDFDKKHLGTPKSKKLFEDKN